MWFVTLQCDESQKNVSRTIGPLLCDWSHLLMWQMTPSDVTDHLSNVTYHLEMWNFTFSRQCHLFSSQLPGAWLCHLSMWRSHNSNLLDLTNTFVTLTFIFLLYILYRKPFLKIAKLLARSNPTTWPNPMTQPDGTQLDLTGPDDPTQGPDPTTQPDWTRLDRTRRPDLITRPDPMSMVLWTCQRMKKASEKQLFRIIKSDWTQLDLTGPDDPTRATRRTQRPGPNQQACWYCEPVEGQKEWVRNSCSE
jgi:hypothetical protein